MLTGNDIRSKFLKFFESKGHTIVPSSSLVPDNDPTLMFVNAGMNQFKNVFTGVEKRDYTRATSSQRCVRAGGKHNDLENVGHTARHHTFFEMMGNFSFGDYFKEQAIPYAWEFLTSKEYMDLPAEKLYATIYHTDEEAYAIWRKIWHEAGLSDAQIEKEERIIKIATSDNFWTMGDTGPCGPCTEIFYDHGEAHWGGKPGTPEEDGDRFIEIWNIVFMQFERFADGTQKPLPQTGVDTGCGLERLTAVLQHHNNNYEIDLFQDIIQKASKLAGIEYKKDTETTVSFRVIADHLRCAAFLLTDGVMPSNEGRGYVLRRVMRRAMRHLNMLGIKEPFMFKLVGVLCEAMGEQYPELVRARAMIEDMIKTEEERFGKTLSKGLSILEEEMKTMKAGEKFSGEIAFKLYDTFGFPLDLTQDALLSRKFEVDVEIYEKCMAEQRAKARAAGMGGTGQEKLAAVWFDLRDALPSTEFLGYEYTSAEGEIGALVKDDAKAESLAKGDEGYLLTNQTPFYGESGGQVGDTGFVKTATGSAKILDTQKLFDGALVQHKIKVTKGTLESGQTAELIVDDKRRQTIKNNHSATHLMHKALQDILGEHVFQKGSVVSAEKLRFDFSHPKALTQEQMAEIESYVNKMIWENTEVTTRLMDKDAAVEAGAMALFGEKYTDEVRVLTMGRHGLNEKGQPCASVELCGGTHAKRTGDIGLFKLLSDSSVSAGVRRIEAVTGAGAFEYLSQQEKIVKNIASAVKAKSSDVEERVLSLQSEIKKLKQDVKNAQKGEGQSGQSPADLAKTAEDISGVKFVSLALDGVEAGVMREMIDDIKNALGSGVVVVASNNGDKSSIVCGVTKDLLSKYKAGDIVNAAAATLGGKGGGRPDMAMAGGKAGDLNAAITAAKSVL
jgi:alanyl-tRNA synthetase